MSLATDIKVFHSAHTRASSTVLKAHCRYLISTINKKNLKAVLAEIQQLESQYDPEVIGGLIINALIELIDWNDSSKRNKDQTQLLASKISLILSNQPNFSSLVCSAFEGMTLPEDFLATFSGALKLNYIQEITLALGMTKSLSENIFTIGTDYISGKCLAALNQGNPNDKFPDYVVHELLFFLREYDDFQEKEEIIEYFRKNYNSVFSLIPLLSTQATRNDAKRNWKKEALMRQTSPSQDLENSISLSELVDELDLGPNSKISNSSLIHGSMKTHLMNQIVEKLSTSPIPTKMILQAWTIDCTIVLAAFQECYTRDPSLLPQILELVQELKALRLVLDTCVLSNFAIDLAALASLGDFLNLSKWLAEMIEKYGDQFTSKAIAFLKDRIIQQQQLPSVISNPGAKPAEQPKFVILTYEAVQIFMELFKTVSGEGKMSTVVQEEFHVLQQTLESEIFPSDIEKEANDIFSRIYDGLMSIEEIINLLQLLKVSNNLRERKIFQCIIRSFYEEYPHIPKYPEKELQITGILFGSLIQNQLVSYVPLVIALRYVLEALKQPISTNLFKFGFYALEQFIPRLPEWPQYCAHLRQVTHLQQVHMQLYQHIDAIFVASGMNAQPQQLQPQQLQPQQPQSTGMNAQPQLQPQLQAQLQPQLQAQLQPQQQPQQPQPVAEKAAEPQQEFTGHSLNISTLISTQFKIVEPSEDVCDDIHFIFNNLTTGNVEAKCKELTQMLKPEYYDYFSFYLVVKRVSLEENYHELYCRLLFTLGLPKVLNQVRKQTTAAIKTLIESGRTKVSASEKELLLSLAGWIGLITIARDIPLRHNHIALKECLLNAFENGSLISIVPFVSRILKLTKKSKWFKPPNPWTVAILRVFAEIHHYPHVVDPIKFEIEILCNVLEIKMEDIVPSDLLKNKVKYAGPGPITDFESVPEPAKDTSKFSMSYLNINPSIAIFKRQPHLKKAVFLSINNAIRESIQPVIDRLVTIASITTRELVLKDFAMEPDETKMLSAASAMVQSLAGNLATVTCKDNLRLSITNNLRTTLGGPQGKNVPPHIEQAIHTIVQDNIEIACGVVQKVAAEAAVTLMEEQLQEAVQARKTHRERSGRRMQYYDINFVGGHGYSFSSTLPDFLKCNLGGVTPEQLQVYKYFLVSPGANPNIPPKVGGEYYDQDYESIDFKDLQYAEGEKASFPDDGLGFSGSYIQYPDNLSISGQFSAQGQAAVVGLSAEQQQQHQLQHQIHQQQAHGHHPETVPSAGLIQLSAEQAAKKMDLFVVELANILNTLTNISSLSELTSDHHVVQMFSLVGSIIMCTPYKNEIIAYTIQIVLPKLFEPSLLHREAFLTVIDVLVNTLGSARKYITDLLLRSDNAHKFHHEVVPALLHYALLSLPDYDANLSQLILENDPAAIEFATYLYQDVIKASVLNPADLVSTLEALKLKVIPTDTALIALIENIRVIQQQQQQQQALSQYEQARVQAQQHENGASSLISNRKPCTDYALAPKEVPLAQQQLITRLFSEWVSGVVNEKTFVQHLQQYGLFGVIVKGGNDLELLFYQTITEIAVNQYLTSVEQETPDSTPEINCSGIDWLIKLFNILIQYSPEKTTVVRNILSRIIYCLHNSHAAGTSFDQRPYLRLLIGLLKQFQVADPAFDGPQILLLLEFRDAFHFLRPAVYPGFVFAWLELVSHRFFMPKILADTQGWPFVAELLIDFFSFVAPWLKEAQMNPAIHLLYQGILRVLLVLLHDFPEFLCDYHYNFCDVIPQTCIQMRNLILSAFPHSMKLPDPFIPNLKLDLLPEIKDPPRIKSDFYSAIQKVGLIAPLDAFIKTGKPVTFLADLLHILKTTGEDESYNVKAINSIVLYIGTRAIAEVAYQRGELSPLVPMEIFRYLTFNFDNEGRYILFNAIANQLRYPNNHTYYFSCVLLFLFAEASQEIIQEQITRILVERLIVHRPHPWGLLVTFVELVKNQRYNFWGRAFTRCAPEIERLFIQVGTHIAQHKGVP